MDVSERQNRPSSGGDERTLCAPDGEPRCFGCCPPIRPAGYDPLDWAGSLRRELSDHRSRFLAGPTAWGRPVVGFTCWALGFLDRKGRRAGCLLHPAQNRGTDLRYLTGYQAKCAREKCLAAGVFEVLPPEGQEFWLPVAAGLSPLYYSSRRANPLFHLLLWGCRVLEDFRFRAGSLGWTVTELLWHVPELLDSSWNPRADRYLLGQVMAARACSTQSQWMKWVFVAAEELRLRAVERFARPGRPFHGSPCGQTSGGRPFVHRLPIEAELADFLRLRFGWYRASLEEVRKVQDSLENWLNGFGAS